MTQPLNGIERMLRSRRVLVTGAGGFLGQAVCHQLLDHRAGVVALDARPSSQIPAVDWHLGSIPEYRQLPEILKTVDTVVHCAWSTIPVSANADPAQDVLSNVFGSVRLSQMAGQAGVKRFVFLSSGGTIYGKVTAEKISEKMPVAPSNAYGAGKASVEMYLASISQKFQLPVTILRVSNPYGPGQLPWRGQGAVNTMVGCCLENLPFEVWGNGSAVRDYIYIDDVAEAVSRAMLLQSQGLEVFNIGSGRGLDLLELAVEVERAIGIKPRLVFEASRQIDVDRNVLSVAKAERIMAWRPQVTLSAGIRRAADWLDRNRALWSHLVPKKED